MAEWHDQNAATILALDVGATTIKYCPVDQEGHLLDTPRRRPTPYPCTPGRLVEALVARVEETDWHRVGVGFPGEFANGHVVRPGNLNRPGGVTTEVDPELTREWSGYPLQDILCQATGRDVRVVNDATLAALGCCEGRGVEVVVTLGTGVGLALERDGQPVRVRDVGAAQFRDGRTYDQSLGERTRSEDPDRWYELLEEALRGFAEEFSATAIHLAGGNAKRVVASRFTTLPCPVTVHGNEAPLHGAARLFYR
ncbi:MAG: ROK family protein [Acidimicrobiales bacterium]